MLVDASPCEMSISRLLNPHRRGDQVAARVFAVNEIGESEPVEGDGGFLPTVPDAPVMLEIFKRGDGEVQLHWDNGESNGHNAISEYVIRFQKDGASDYDTQTFDSSMNFDYFSQHMYQLTGLENGAEYEISVAASNIAGRGEFFSESFIIGQKPNAPTDVKVRRSDDAEDIIISWASP